MFSWKRNLIIVWICQFVAMIGMSAIVPFLPLFVRELGVSALDETAYWSGLVFAGPFFISFFLSPIWGNLGDRYGRKMMTIRAILGLALAQILVGFSQNVTQLFLARLVQGLLSGFLPAAMALVAASTPKEKTGYALGLLQSATAGGTVLGPLLGGFISDLFGFRAVFFIVAVLLVITGIVVMIFVQEESTSDENNKFSFIDNWKYLLGNSKLLYPAILIMITAFGISFIRPTFVLYVETFPISSKFLPTITGALYSIVGVFSIISAAWWGRKVEQSGISRNVIYASLLTGSMYIAHSLVYNIYLLIPIRILLGFGYGALAPLLFTAISNNVEVERKGGVLGVGSSFQILGNMIGPVLGGFSAGYLGLRNSFAITAIMFFLITIISMTKIKE
ncbi:MAG: MFS transporter [Ignavibacteriaceae bacterium]|nr:MFS transporter [Ignavibacteriaceae bacterium]